LGGAFPLVTLVEIAAVLAARLNSVSLIFRETSKTRAGRAGNLDKRGAS
jgi:hypothetical protein